MELLVGGTVDDLWVEGLLVVGVDRGCPVECLATVGGEADAVDVEGVELGRLGGWHTVQRHLSDLELVF